MCCGVQSVHNDARHLRCFCSIVDANDIYTLIYFSCNVADSDHCANLCILCWRIIASCHGCHVPEEASYSILIVSVQCTFSIIIIISSFRREVLGNSFVLGSPTIGVGVGTLIYAWYTRQRGSCHITLL